MFAPLKSACEVPKLRELENDIMPESTLDFLDMMRSSFPPPAPAQRDVEHLLKLKTAAISAAIFSNWKKKNPPA